MTHQPKYDKFLIQDAARRLLETNWEDNEAAKIFSDETLIMFRCHIYKYRIFLQADIIQDIHQDWLLKIIKNQTLEGYREHYGRTLYSWLYTSMRYHFLSVCLASKNKKYHWAKHEVAISQLKDAMGDPMTFENLELDDQQENS